MGSRGLIVVSENCFWPLKNKGTALQEGLLLLGWDKKRYAVDCRVISCCAASTDKANVSLTV
jgi:hypothetical protein